MTTTRPWLLPTLLAAPAELPQYPDPVPDGFVATVVDGDVPDPPVGGALRELLDTNDVWM